MILNGYKIQEAILDSLEIKNFAHKKYLSSKFSIKPGDSLPSFQMIALDEEQVKNVVTSLKGMFNVQDISEIKNKKVYILSSISHVLCIINSEDFNIFSLEAKFRSDKSWIVQNLSLYPELLHSNLSEERKINLSFIKTALTNEISNLHSKDKEVLELVNKMFLAEKLKHNLILNDNNNKKFKL